MATLCAGTPKISVRDNRGLDVRTLRYNRNAAGAVATQYVDAQTHDVLGHAATSQDPRFFGSETLNFQNTTALSGQVLKTVSADAGTSKGCADIAGRPIWSLTEGCDAYIHSNNKITVRIAYDALSRLAQRDCLTSNMSGAGQGGGTTDTWRYGDYCGTPGVTYATTDTVDPRNANQRGQAIQHHDTAGLLDMSVLGYALAGGGGGASAGALRQDRYFDASVFNTASSWVRSDGDIDSANNSDRPDGDTPFSDTPLHKNKATLASGDPYSTRWTFNALGQVLIQNDAKGHQQLTSYDSAGRKYAASVTPKGGTLTPVTTGTTYNAAGAIDTRSDANNIQAAYVYEPQTTQRLISVTATRASTKIQALTYTYDGVGNVTALSDNSAGAQVSFFRNRAVTPDRGYTYDALYQLTSATGRENYVNDTPKGTDWPGAMFDPSSTSDYQPYTRTYNYDTGGNLIAIGSPGWSTASPPTRTMIVDSTSNRAVCAANNPSMKPEFVYLQFDPAGKNINVDANSYHPMYWTGLHQLYCVVTTWRLAPGIDNEWASSDREQYAYDGNGQRVRKYVNSMVNSGSGVNAWNTIDTRYLPGLELRTNTATGEDLEVIVLDDGARVLNWAGGAGKPSDIPNLQLRFQYTDRQSSCQIETDKDGNVITQEEYYPYGGTAVLTSRSNSEVKYKYIRYSGKERDATGLYYYGMRYYQPWIGRWINPDPAGSVDGQNLYCMVGNNPTTMEDGNGLTRTRPNRDDGQEPAQKKRSVINLVPLQMLPTGNRAPQAASTSTRPPVTADAYTGGSPRSPRYFAFDVPVSRPPPAQSAQSEPGLPQINRDAQGNPIGSSPFQIPRLPAAGDITTAGLALPLAGILTQLKMHMKEAEDKAKGLQKQLAKAEKKVKSAKNDQTRAVASAEVTELTNQLAASTLTSGSNNSKSVDIFSVKLRKNSVQRDINPIDSFKDEYAYAMRQTLLDALGEHENLGPTRDAPVEAITAAAQTPKGFSAHKGFATYMLHTPGRIQVSPLFMNLLLEPRTAKKYDDDVWEAMPDEEKAKYSMENPQIFQSMEYEIQRNEPGASLEKGYYYRKPDVTTPGNWALPRIQTLLKQKKADLGHLPYVHPYTRMKIVQALSEDSVAADFAGSKNEPFLSNRQWPAVAGFPGAHAEILARDDALLSGFYPTRTNPATGAITLVPPEDLDTHELSEADVADIERKLPHVLSLITFRIQDITSFKKMSVEFFPPCIGCQKVLGSHVTSELTPFMSAALASQMKELNIAATRIANGTETLDNYMNFHRYI